LLDTQVNTNHNPDPKKGLLIYYYLSEREKENSMKSRQIAVSVLCVAMAFGASSTAWAQEWLKSFDVASLHARNGAVYETGFGANAGLHMGATGSPAFEAAFLVPPEYTPGRPLYLGVFWHTDSATPCGIELRPNFTSIARIGRTHIQGPGAADGLGPLDGSTVLIATATNTTNLKIYTITSPDVQTNLQPFDSINFGLYRPADAPADTCEGNLIVSGIAVAILD
jgi:hypothetical protein